jgi:hypothetical protein
MAQDLGNAEIPGLHNAGSYMFPPCLKDHLVQCFIFQLCFSILLYSCSNVCVVMNAFSILSNFTKQIVKFIFCM